jgi:hypothetical protein
VVAATKSKSQMYCRVSSMIPSAVVIPISLVSSDHSAWVE